MFERRRTAVVVLAVGLMAGCGASSHPTDTSPPPDAGVRVDASVGTDAGSALDSGVDASPPSCDEDEDGRESESCGGNDCDDADPTIHPGAPDGTAWQVETLAVASLASPTVALDPEGAVWAAFYDDLDVVLARRDPDGWTTSVVEQAVRAEYWTIQMRIALAFGPGATHVLYWTGDQLEDGGLRHAHDLGGGWGFDPPLGPQGLHATMVVDATGVAHVAFASGTAAVYADDATIAWVTTTLDEGAADGGYESLALDADGSMHIVYQAIQDRARQQMQLRYLHSGTDWTWPIEPEVVGSARGTGFNADIAVGPEGPEVCFLILSRDGNSVVHAYRDESWHEDTIAEEEAGTMTGSALQIVGEQVAIVWADLQGVHHAMGRRGGPWVVDSIDDGAGTLAFAASATAEHLVLETSGEIRHLWREGLDGVDQDCDGVPDA